MEAIRPLLGGEQLDILDAERPRRFHFLKYQR
jgi:hypothetical protein